MQKLRVLRFEQKLPLHKKIALGKVIPLIDDLIKRLEEEVKENIRTSGEHSTKLSQLRREIADQQAHKSAVIKGFLKAEREIRPILNQEKISKREERRRQLHNELSTLKGRVAQNKLVGGPQGILENQILEGALKEREQEIHKLDKEINELTKKAESRVTIHVSPSIKWVQVYPLDLHDCSFKIEGQDIPKFISKIPGQAHHYIGSIKYTSSKATPRDALDDFIRKGFVEIFSFVPDSAPSSLKDWFIDSLELIINDQHYLFKKIAVQLYPSARSIYELSYVYEDPGNNLWQCSDIGGCRQLVYKQQFKNTIRSFQVATVPSPSSLYEATAGGETAPYTAVEKMKIERQRGKMPSDEKTTQEIAAERFLSDL